ncbi:hypothetical protein [Candidatus Vampirococcus lugosii]|uniref:Uncharacterized protein n=1 Tax=Candidatus Vampirococcus lugosii TaxID=2789015 RepID=A0ABS5QNB3_9BACT|nr:hypothetical protein [Candidatus Vampirococcus lugosii]MBS8122504.1 hypothetical protein [Candidatus Vampirococcus lugosii]
MTNFLYNKLEEFKKEFKKLQKKYPSLKDDLDIVKLAIERYPKGYGDNIIQISDLGKEVKIPIMKVRKFPCKSLKDNKSLRLVYAYKEDKKEIDLIELDLIEIYHKNIKENHNIDRIKKYYGNNLNK